MMKFGSIKVFVVFSFCSIYSIVTLSQQMPDFYSEAASVSDRGGHSEAPNEVLDPFTGTVNLVHNDVVIPGDGGMDIRIQRVYSSQNVYSKGNGQNELTILQARTQMGLGWTMHFGRIRMAIGSTPCSEVGQKTTTNKPVVELSDGSQQQLYCNDYESI